MWCFSGYPISPSYITGGQRTIILHRRECLCQSLAQRWIPWVLASDCLGSSLIFTSNYVKLGSLSVPQAPHLQNVIDKIVCVLNEIIQEKLLARYLTQKKYSVNASYFIVRSEGEFSLYSRAFLYCSHSDLLQLISIFFLPSLSIIYTFLEYNCFTMVC